MNSEERIKITCDRTAELLSGYIDGELSAEDESRVKAHLDVCPACRELYADLQKTLGLAKDVGDAFPSDLHASIMEKVRATPQTPARASGFRRIVSRTVPIAAALLCFIGITVWMSARGGMGSYSLFNGTKDAAAKEDSPRNVSEEVTGFDADWNTYSGFRTYSAEVDGDEQTKTADAEISEIAGYVAVGRLQTVVSSDVIDSVPYVADTLYLFEDSMTFRLIDHSGNPRTGSYRQEGSCLYLTDEDGNVAKLTPNGNGINVWDFVSVGTDR